MQQPGLISQILPESIRGLNVGSGAHQVVTPFSTLSTAITVPGLVSTFQTRPSQNVRRNKTTVISNETIHATIKPTTWRTRHYEQRQKPGNLLFVSDPRQKNETVDMETLTLAQINNLLREYYNQVIMKAKPRPGPMMSEFETATLAADPYCEQLLARLQEEGERIFDDEGQRNEILFKINALPCIGLSRRLILSKWRFLGVYIADDGQGTEFDAAGGSRAVTCAVGGPTRVQQTDNVWRAREAQQFVGFILTRRFDKHSGKYREFQFMPWVSSDAAPLPSMDELRYYDDAGVVQYGTFVPVGKVSETPLSMDISPPEICNIVAGLTGSETEAYATTLETVAIVVGPSRAHLDLYQC